MKINPYQPPEFDETHSARSASMDVRRRVRRVCFWTCIGAFGITALTSAIQVLPALVTQRFVMVLGPVGFIAAFLYGLLALLPVREEE